MDRKLKQRSKAKTSILRGVISNGLSCCLPTPISALKIDFNNLEY